MQITLLEILKNNFFDKVKIISGKNKINNVVTCIVSSDITEDCWSKGSSYFIEFNELYGQIKDIKLLIEKLVKNHVSGMIIKVEEDDERYKKASLDLIKYGEEFHLPIIAVSTKKQMKDIIFLMMLQINKSYHNTYVNIRKIYDEFANLSLKNKGIDEIINYFSKLVGNPVAVYDQDYKCISSTDRYLNNYTTIQGTSIEKGLNNLYYFRQKIRFIDDKLKNKKEVIQILFPIRFQNKIKAYLAVFEIKRALDDIDYFVLEIAATSTLLEMKKHLAIKTLEERFVNDLIYDLMNEKFDNDGILDERARLIGLNLEDKHFVILFKIERLSKDIEKSQQMFETNEDRIYMEIKRKINENNPQCIIGKLSDSIIILWPISHNDNNSLYQIKEVCKNIYKEINKRSTASMSIGIGKIAKNVKEIARSYRETKDVVALGKIMYGKDVILGINDLGVLRFLCKVDDPKMLIELIPDALIKLKKYDESHRTNLLETLKLYLEYNSNATKTAKNMFIHYKTILYRLERINTVCKIDLANHYERLEIEMGIRIMNLLEYKGYII